MLASWRLMAGVVETALVTGRLFQGFGIRSQIHLIAGTLLGLRIPQNAVSRYRGSLRCSAPIKTPASNPTARSAPDVLPMASNRRAGADPAPGSPASSAAPRSSAG